MSILRVLVERGRVVIWFLTDTLHMIVFPLVWLAAYGERDMIHGFTRADTITYFIVIVIIEVTSNSHSDEVLTRDIQKGDLNMHLLRPIPRLLTLLFTEIGYKMIYSLLLLPALFALLFFFPDWILLPKTFAPWFFTILAALVGFAMTEMIGYIMGGLSFWLTDARPVRRLVLFASVAFSGQIAPLEFFPDTLRRIAEVLPFQFWASFPARLFTGHLQPQDILSGFLLAAFWIALLGVLVSVVWNRGVRRYEGIGI